MSPKSYMNGRTESYSDQPTSPWTEAFGFHVSESAQPQQADEMEHSRSFESDDQSPTYEALSAIYNRDY